MKRTGYLIEKIADMDNLRLAFIKAAKGKEAKSAVILYRDNLAANLLLLHNQIQNNDVVIGDYHYFTIYDPKERLICAADFSERVLHHAIMNICHPVFEKAQIYDSYACRKGKGVYAALDRAFVFTKKYNYYLKLDVRKYFDSINHFVIKDLLRASFKDYNLLCLFDSIIDSYSRSENCGLPIGNLTSQYLANHYLSKADHYIKEKLLIPAYVRYMDDMILWHNDKNQLLEAGKQLADYLDNNFKLSLKPFCLNTTTKGLPFLSYLIYPDKIRLTARSRQRFIKKFNTYESNLKTGEWSQSTYQKHILPLVAFTEYADAKNFRRKIIYEKNRTVIEGLEPC